jgi:hypothetical protein
MGGALTEQQLNWTRAFTGLEIGGMAGSFDPPGILEFGPGPDRGSPGTPLAGTPPPPDPAVEKAKTAIEQKFPVKIASDGGSSWKSAELSTVSQALDAIPAADADALRDVTIDRVPAIDNGRTARAEYQTSTNFDKGTQTKTMLVGDGAYVDPQSGKPYPADEQKRAIVHEVGHAVAKKAQTDADLAYAKAVAETHKAEAARDEAKAKFDALKQSRTGPDPTDEWVKAMAEKPRDAKKVTKWKAEMDKREAEDKPFSDAQAAAWQKVDAAQKAQDNAKAAASATRVPTAVVQAGQAKADAAGAAAAAAGTRASGSAAAQDQDSVAYRNASAAVAAKLKAYAEAITAGKVGLRDDQTSPDKWDEDVAKAIGLRDAERHKLESKSKRNPALAAFADVDRAQGEWNQNLQTQARLPDRTPKVQEFVELVERNRIDPKSLTAYAAQSWPAKPEEFFAEAYSFWRTNPGKLPKPLLDWFQGGKYR